MSLYCHVCGSWTGVLGKKLDTCGQCCVDCGHDGENKRRNSHALNTSDKPNKGGDLQKSADGKGPGDRRVRRQR